MNRIALGLIIFGAINWGLIGLLNFNIVGGLLGPTSLLTRIIYVAVGIAGLYSLTFFASDDIRDRVHLRDGDRDR